MKKTLPTLLAGLALGATFAAIPLSAQAATMPGYTTDLYRRGFPLQYTGSAPDTPYTMITILDNVRMSKGLRFVVYGDNPSCKQVATADVPKAGLAAGAEIMAADHWADVALTVKDLGVTAKAANGHTLITYYDCEGVPLTVRGLITYDGPSGDGPVKGPDAPVVTSPDLPPVVIPDPGAETPNPDPSTPPVTPTDPPVNPGDQSADSDTIEARIATIVNEERKAAGLGPVTVKTELSTVAAMWSDRMALTGVFEHSTIDPAATYYKLFPAGWTWAAENIVKTSAPNGKVGDDMMRLWMNSPGHRANILDPRATSIGVGVTQDQNGTWYGTQEFARYAPR